MSFSSSPRSRPLLSSSSSSGSERKEEDVVSDVKDEGFEDDPVARLPRLDFWTSLLLDISLVLFPRQRVAASPPSSSLLLSPPSPPAPDDARSRRNRVAGVLYAKGSRRRVLLSSSSKTKSFFSFVNTIFAGPVVFPDDDPPLSLSFRLCASKKSSSTMNCHRSHPEDDDFKHDDDTFTDRVINVRGGGVHISLKPSFSRVFLVPKKEREKRRRGI